MKKAVISIGVFLVAILMISTATAVPTTQSKPVMDIVNTIEEQEQKIELLDVLPQGIFDTIWQLLLALYNLIMKIIEVVNTVLTIVQLVQALINGIQTLLQMIQEFIALINDLLNPDGMAQLV
jgi:hypothetical protein